MLKNASAGEKAGWFNGRTPLFSQKDLLRLVGPLLIEQFLAVTVGMADTMMVSRCGEAAISGVSLVDMINNLIIVLFAALATGGAVVVSQYPEVLELAHRMGFVPVPNRHPDWGISHTISLGLGKLPEMDAALFQVADQPLLRRESVGSLVDFYREHPEHIAALGHDGVRGNPCLFPARLFPELLALQGDHGGNQVIRRHEEDLLLWEVPAPELTDVDTPQVLAQLRRDMAEE